MKIKNTYFPINNREWINNSLVTELTDWKNTTVKKEESIQLLNNWNKYKLT